MENTGTVAPLGTAIRTIITKSPISVDDILKAEFQKEGTISAQLRQVVETKSFYPSKKISNNMQDNLFATEDFGFAETEFLATENRVTWMDIPEGTTAQQVLDKLTNSPKANLYRVLSNKPILTDSQEYAIGAGTKTMDDFAEAQIVRYPESTILNENTPEAQDVSNEIVLDKNGKVQYRRIFFSATGKEDVDTRTKEVEDVYMSKSIKMELEGAGQKVI